MSKTAPGAPDTLDRDQRGCRKYVLRLKAAAIVKQQDNGNPVDGRPQFPTVTIQQKEWRAWLRVKQILEEDIDKDD